MQVTAVEIESQLEARASNATPAPRALHRPSPSGPARPRSHPRAPEGSTCNSCQEGERKLALQDLRLPAEK